MTRAHIDRELYNAPPAFDKTAGIQMPPDIELWSEVIFRDFAERYPDLAEISSGDVEWIRDTLDEEAGFGTGWIIVNSRGNIIRIPVVVEDFRLKPIDIFEYDGDMRLINKENIGYALREQDSVGEVAFPEQSHFNSNLYNRWINSYKTASQSDWERRKTFLETITAEHDPYLNKAADAFSFDPELAFQGTDGDVVLFEKVGKADLRLVEYKEGQVTRTEKVGYKNPAITESTELRDAAKLAFNNGSALCAFRPMDARIGFLDVDVNEKVAAIQRPGVYTTRHITEDGDIQPRTAYVMQQRPLGSKTASNELAIIVQDGKQVKTAQDNRAVGRPVDAQEFSFEDKVAMLSEMPRHSAGYLLYTDKVEKHASVDECSEYMTLERTEQTPNGHIRIFLRAGPDTIHYLIEPFLRSVEELPQEDPHYTKQASMNLTGPDLPFLKVAGTLAVIPSLQGHQRIYNEMIKGAADEGDPMVLQKMQTAQGERIMAKHGARQYEDSPRRFMARMMSFGIPPEKTARLISALNGEAMTVVGLDASPPTKEALSEAERDVMDFVQSHRDDFVKAAANLGAGGKTDEANALVGLAMMDEENMRQFAQAQPMLEDTAATLGQMLYASRTNQLNVDEGAIKSALTNLTKVLGMLRDVTSGI